MKLLVPEYWEKGRGGLHPSSVLATGLDRHYIALQRAAVGLATDDDDRRQAREMLEAFLKAAAAPR